MAYAGYFHRLVLQGTLYDDTFNTTMSIVPVGGTFGLDTDLAAISTSLAPLISNWWNDPSSTAPGIAIHAGAKLTGFKLNQIGPDGHYVNDPTNEYVYGSPVQGGYAVFAVPQVATVATLRTAVERGNGSKGRMFLPCVEGFYAPDADGRASVVHATRTANAVRALIELVNGVYAARVSGDEATGKVGVASRVGAGVFRPVTHVTVGRAPDTMRSRRNKQSEAPVSSSPVS